MRRLLPIILLAVSLALGTWLGTKTGTRLPGGPVLKVYFLDVGQGDCSVIISPDGKTVLIDGGEAEAGPGVVGFLRAHAVKRIDLLVMTHPHSDHIGGIPDVLENFDVGRVLDSAYPHGSNLQYRILKMIEEKGIPYYAAQAGQKLTIGKSLTAHVLAPDTEFLTGTDSDANNNSVVMQFVFGKTRLLFTGDIQHEAEGALIESGRVLESNVLKVAHHGSSDSSSLEFLRHVKPDFVIISAGRDNPYHHPHKETLRRMDPGKLGAEVFRTDQVGTIALKTDGNSVLVETER